MADLNQLGAQLQDELNQAVAGFKAKGAEAFKKALVVAGAIAVVGFVFLYQIPSKRLTVMRSKVYALREISQYAEQYRDFKNRLGQLSVRFPGAKERKDWLFGLIMTAANEQGVKIDSISSQKETQKPELPFILLSIEVSARGTYHELGRWVARLEQAGFFTHTESFSIQRLPQEEKGQAPTPVRSSKLVLTTAVPTGLEGL